MHINSRQKVSVLQLVDRDASLKQVCEYMSSTLHLARSDKVALSEEFIAEHNALIHNSKYGVGSTYNNKYILK